MRELEVAIVGTGVSGLLLTRSLLEQGGLGRIWIIGRLPKLAPHVLSYWAAGSTPFDRYAVAQWSRLAVFTNNSDRVDVELSKFTYRTMRAQVWADASWAEISADPRVKWVDAQVSGIDDHLDHAIITASGFCRSFDWVFTSVGKRVQPDAWQRFAGWEVEMPEGAFDTARATLLDFRTPAQRDFRFAYALPLSSTRLFVEHVSYQPCDHAAFLEQYLRRTLRLPDFRRVACESGATPVFIQPPLRRGDRVVRIGVVAGLAKPSTGYALLRMWRDARQIARSLATHQEPRWPAPLPSVYHLADRFFGNLLKEEPEALGELLPALFTGASGDAAMAFLSEESTVREQWEVAMAMPRWLQWALDLNVIEKESD